MSRPNHESGPDAAVPFALRELPTIEPDARAVARSAREARAAFVSAFADEPWRVRAIRGPIGRAFVPMGLAGLIAVYVMWAVSSALTLMQ